MTIKKVFGNLVEGTMHLSCRACGGAVGYNQDYGFSAILAGNVLTIPQWPHWSPLEIEKDGTAVKGTFAAAGVNFVSLTKASKPGKRTEYGLEFADTQEAIQRGEGREALGYYERQASELERRGPRLDAAKAHSAVAFVASRLGQYQKAIRSGLRALELLKLEPPTPEILSRRADAYSVVGNSYKLAGDLVEARRHFQEGLDLARSFLIGGVIDFRSGHFLWALGDLALSEGDYSRALQHGGEAIRRLESAVSTLPAGAQFARLRYAARRGLAGSLLLVGIVHGRLGNSGEGETALRRALELTRELRAKETEARTLEALGWVALDRQDSPGALRQFQEALALATRLNSVTRLIFTHAGIGQSYFQQGRFDEALAAYRRSVELMEGVRGELQEAGLRSGFLEDKQAIYHGAVKGALALGKPEEAFSYAERGRARAFLDLLGSQTVLSKGKTRALVEEEVRLRARLSEAQALAQEVTDAGDPAPARHQVEAAEQAYRAFLDQVRKENLEQASLMAVEPVTLQEVQGYVPEGTTLLEYLVTADETVLWVIDRQQVKVVRLPVPRSTLVSEVRAFRQVIAERAPVEQVQDRSRGLYERVFASARPHLRGDRLLIVPHDVLHYLPFSALRTPEGRWLVENYTLSTLPSASVLKYLKGKGERAGGRALAVGNPDVGPALALRYAEREVRVVGERYPGATVLVRQQATEARAKTLSGEAGLLHFATHGELNEQDPLSSALLLVPEGAEDGRLEVREIFGLELNARLVVLSACETGLGKLSRGDELVGLQRAFLYAGTPAVVTTLWKVDDRASYVLIRAFYEYLKGRDPAEALRQAQRRAMGEFPHPLFWAAFGLTGVPR